MWSNILSISIKMGDICNNVITPEGIYIIQGDNIIWHYVQNNTISWDDISYPPNITFEYINLYITRRLRIAGLVTLAVAKFRMLESASAHEQYKIIYSLTMHELKMRIFDTNNGVSQHL